ncbi:MAG: FGGY family carbohydrate kinase [Eubacterium sp.]
MKEKKYLVGVDCGTTSTKTVIFDFKGTAMGFGQIMNPLTYPAVGRVECDGPEMINTLYETTRIAIENSGVDPEEIAGVSFDMFRCTMVTRDENDGFTTPIIIWQDLRSAEMLPDMVKQLEAGGMTPDDLYDMCGMPLGGVNPSGKLQWVIKNRPEAYENAAHIHTMMGLLTKAYGADDYYDDINDTPWLQLNGKDFQYSKKLCDIFGVDMNKLSPLRKTGTIIGNVSQEVSAKTGLAVGTPLVMGTGDQQSGCIGCGCTSEGIGYACGGTAGITAGKSKNFLRDPVKKCYILGTPDGAWVMEGQANASGSAFKWFKNEICKIEDIAAQNVGLEVYDFLTTEAKRSTPGANGVFFLPYLQGANTPNYDANARGTYIGMTFAHTRSDLIRATMEGVCYDIRDMLEAMVAGNVPDFDTVRLTGGISRSHYWCQMQADIYNRPCETVAVEEATALGCAMVAAVGVGVYKNYEEAANHMVKVTRRYEPDPEAAARYEDAYQTWRTVFKALSGDAFEAVTGFQEKYR